MYQNAVYHSRSAEIGGAGVGVESGPESDVGLYATAKLTKNRDYTPSLLINTYQQCGVGRERG